MIKYVYQALMNFVLAQYEVSQYLLQLILLHRRKQDCRSLLFSFLETKFVRRDTGIM